LKVVVCSRIPQYGADRDAAGLVEVGGDGDADDLGLGVEAVRGGLGDPPGRLLEGEEIDQLVTAADSTDTCSLANRVVSIPYGLLTRMRVSSSRVSRGSVGTCGLR
jgi:hypothetical protein